MSSWPLMTSSSISESINNHKILQETVEIPFASTESDIIAKINSEYVNTDLVNPHHDGNLKDFILIIIVIIEKNFFKQQYLHLIIIQQIGRISLCIMNITRQNIKVKLKITVF